MVTTEWFCQVMGSEVGPLSQRQLVDMVRQHQLNPEDLVRRNTSGWVPAFEVKGLFEAAAKPVAPVAERSPPSEESDAKQSVPQTESEESRLADSTARRQHVKENPKPKDRRIDRAHVDTNHNESKDDWFCIASGEKCGPLGFEELKAMAGDGTLRGRDRVWRASWPKFQKAEEVDGLDITK